MAKLSEAAINRAILLLISIFCLYHSIFGVLRCPAFAHGQRQVKTVVYAVRDIPEGNTIASFDLGCKTVSKDSLPKGILEKTQAHAAYADTHYLSSPKAAIGTISKGVRKGQILYFSWPGYRGNSVIMAKSDIPAGTELVPGLLEEKDINPALIAPEACESMGDALGKISKGIKKGQLVTWVRGDAILTYRAGAFPGPDPRADYACARVKIKAGTRIGANQIRCGKMRYQRWAPAPVHDFIANPVGRIAKYDLEKGQIITKDCLFK